MANNDDKTNSWREYIKNVKPLITAKPQLTAQDKVQILSSTTRETPIISEPVAQIRKKELHLSDSSDVDKHLRRKMDAGLLKIDRTLDLHGYNRNDAFVAFKSFINDAFMQDKRMLLVITGKGVKSEYTVSVLKQELPHWINDDEIKTKILRSSLAKPKHGGEGAYYILLKRKRNDDSNN